MRCAFGYLVANLVVSLVMLTAVCCSLFVLLVWLYVAFDVFYFVYLVLAFLFCF